jgi:hypothetical protein
MDELKEEDSDAEQEDLSLVHDPDQVIEDDEDDEQGNAVEHAAWIPGQGVFVDYASIMDITIQHVAYPGELEYRTVLSSQDLTFAPLCRRAYLLTCVEVDLELLDVRSGCHGRLYSPADTGGPPEPGSSCVSGSIEATVSFNGTELSLQTRNTKRCHRDQSIVVSCDPGAACSSYSSTSNCPSTWLRSRPFAICGNSLSNDCGVHGVAQHHRSKSEYVTEQQTGCGGR